MVGWATRGDTASGCNTNLANLEISTIICSFWSNCTLQFQSGLSRAIRCKKCKLTGVSEYWIARNSRIVPPVFSLGLS